MRLSHTSMEQYLRCPQGWKLRYVDGHKELPKPYFNKGSAVHAALEVFYRDCLVSPPPVEKLLAAFEEEFDPEAYATDDERERARADGEQMVRDFYALHSADFHPALAVERDFFFEFDGIPFRAKVDRIDKVADDCVRVVDYKTGQLMTRNKVEGSPQLTLYQVAVEDQLGMRVESLEMYHVPSQTPIRIEPRGEEQLVELRNRVFGVVRGVEDEAFEPVQQPSCGSCDFRPWCCLFADEFPENHPVEPALLIPTRAEAAELADQYGHLKKQTKELSDELESTRAHLQAYFAATGDRASSGREYRVTATCSERWSFDHEELRSLLEPAGLYEKVLAPDWHREAGLRDDPEIRGTLRRKVEEIAEVKESWRLNYRTKDG